MSSFIRFAIVVGFICLLVVGCDTESEFDRNEAIKVKKCEEQGGIPILHIWDNRLAGCVFKENN